MFELNVEAERRGDKKMIINHSASLRLCVRSYNH